MSTALQPAGHWIRIDFSFAGLAETDVWQVSARPWADPDSYYDGLKRKEVEAYEVVERSLSDSSGSPVVPRFSFVIFDRNGRWRARLHDANRKYWTGQSVTYFLASSRAHLLGSTPRIGFRGQISRPVPLSNRRFRINCESRLGSKYGPYDADSPVLKVLFDVNHWPTMPRETANKPIPVLWGPLSDAGTKNSLEELVAAGMAKAEYLGFPAGAEPEYGLQPTNLQVEVYGGGPTKTVRCAVTFRNANGETNATIITVNNYPRNPGPTPVPYSSSTPSTVGASWTWDDPNPPGTFSSGRVFLDNLDGTGWHCIDAGYLWYVDNGDDDHWKNLYPPPPLSNTALISGTNSRWFFCFLRNPGKITELYVSNLEADPAYIPVPEAEVGEGNFFDLGPNNDGINYVVSGQNYFGFWAYGQRAQQAVDNKMPIYGNLCGWPDADGLMIDKAMYVYQDVLTQLRAGPDGKGWRSGNRFLTPVFGAAPTIPMIQTTTYEGVQARAATQMGDGYGPKATVYINDAEYTWRQFYEDMNVSYKVNSGENADGQDLVAMLDPTATPVAYFRERAEIRRIIDAGEVMAEDIENVSEAEYDYDPRTNAYRSGILPLREDTSVAEYHGEFKSAGTLQLRFVRDPATYAWVTGRYIAEMAYGQAFPEFASTLRRGMNVELGQCIAIQHRDLQADVWLKLYIMRHVVDKGEVRIKGQLIGVL